VLENKAIICGISDSAKKTIQKNYKPLNINHEPDSLPFQGRAGVGSYRWHIPLNSGAKPSATPLYIPIFSLFRFPIF